MSQVWQLQEAKNKFSQIVNSAIYHGPQIITRHGEKVAIVLSYNDYRKMAGAQKKLSAFFRESPLAEVDLDLSRDQSEARPTLEL
jgi:prevent-host-death family protein